LQCKAEYSLSINHLCNDILSGWATRITQLMIPWLRII
jgi:hypothetical protein